MRRTAVRALLGTGLLVASLAMAGGARAAGEVVVAVSPSEVEVGDPVEVLVRTFVPFQRSEDFFDLPSPQPPYPGSADLWNVLYPWSDLPGLGDVGFDIVAKHDDGTEVAVTVVRDPSDSTLWRGSVSLPIAGTWTIWVRNFREKGPGSTTIVTVRPDRPATPSPQPATATASTSGLASIEAGPAALIGTLVGLVVGALVALVWRRRPTS
jgi:uncharacterized OB-fold protein